MAKNLADRIAKEFRYDGLHVYPIARRIEEMVRRARRVDLKRMLAALAIAFTLGFALCFAWFGLQITAINENIVAWRQEYIAEHKKHHAAELKSMTSQAARSVVGKLDKEKEVGDARR